MAFAKPAAERIIQLTQEVTSFCSIIAEASYCEVVISCLGFF